MVEDERKRKRYFPTIYNKTRPSKSGDEKLLSFTLKWIKKEAKKNLARDSSYKTDPVLKSVFDSL